MRTSQPRTIRRIATLAGALTLALLAAQGPAGAMPGMSGQASTAAPDTGTSVMPKTGPLPATPAASADLSKARKVRDVMLVVRHRVFHDFVENIEAMPSKAFPIGDTDYDATIIQYVPDFAMDIKTGKVVSRTDQANNPAFRIIVREKGVPTDTTWALLDSPPHYARKSMLAFQAVRIDFTSGKPLYSKLATPPGGNSK